LRRRAGCARRSGRGLRLTRIARPRTLPRAVFRRPILGGLVVVAVISLATMNVAVGVLAAICALASPVFVAVVLDREHSRDWPDELI
jgi:hypothetical protein